MIGRIIEIEKDGCQLGRDRGSMTVSIDGEEVGRIPLDDIEAVICNARDISYTNGLLTALAERGATLVICGRNFAPVAWLWPVAGHHVQTLRMRQQLSATLPFRKRVWRDIVKAKLRQQARALGHLGIIDPGIKQMGKRVLSGDTSNIEAQAARIYWPALFGREFRRGRTGLPPNGLLNYGYTVVRTAVGRSVMASGLHPSVPLHHSNRGNAFCLADDLMEPFRPLVDVRVASIVREHGVEVTSEAKRALTGLLFTDMDSPDGTTPLQTCILRTAQALAAMYEDATPSRQFIKYLTVEPAGSRT